MKQDNIIEKKQLQREGLDKPINVGFLKTRDNDFDTTKSFLIISMIIAHSFQRMWVFKYDMNLTYYVIIGFVFLAGLTLGSVFYDKLLSNRSQFSWYVFSRGLKLFIIFLLTNTIIILLSPQLLSQLLVSEPHDIFLALMDTKRRINTQGVIFSFLVLVPISLTFIFGLPLLIWKNKTLDWFLLSVIIIALWIIEITGNLDYYTVDLMIVGCIGVLLAKILTAVNWIAFRSVLSKWILPIFICYFVYQAGLVAGNPDAHFLVQHYIIVTILLLLAIYLVSYRLKLTSFVIVGLLNHGLAKYMLFAYLFHIFFLVILGKFVSRGNFCFALVIGLFTFALTISAGLTVDLLTKKNKAFNKLYAFIFK